VVAASRAQLHPEALRAACREHLTGHNAGEVLALDDLSRARRSARACTARREHQVNHDDRR
jgi:hypothetical protein